MSRPFKIVIPARYDSKRFPGKMLADINGKPLIQHTYEHACECKDVAEVIIATDDYRIKDIARAFDADVQMTGKHSTGTDRIAQIVVDRAWKKDNIIVNLQGDEPTMPHKNIRQVVKNLHAHPNWDVATLAEKIYNRGEFENPNIVKVLWDVDHRALLFSRSPIPFIGFKSFCGFRHIGLYAYTGATLHWYYYEHHCGLEDAESLEQLRILYSGGKVHVAEAKTHIGPSVDTPDDIGKVEEYLHK